VREAVLEVLPELDAFIVGMVVQHELQHGETMAQTLAFAGMLQPTLPEVEASGEVAVLGGPFSLGSVDPWAYDNERPAHVVALRSFRIDRALVSNAEYAAFVDAGGYGDPDLWSDVGWAWREAEGAVAPFQWNREAAPREPVQHVSFHEAEAYARWAGKRLPTEAEFEWAARGGLDRKKFVWGDELKPDGKFRANTFQGNFPNKNTGEDGFLATAPVGTFAPNEFGLFDVAGNVWEWCSDWYRADYYAALARQGSIARNPQGPADSLDPREPGTAKRVTKGGSFLCTDQYCARYMPGGRGKEAPDTGTNHIGFRLVRNAT
jgi:sulfatase modifying factor 1